MHHIDLINYNYHTKTMCNRNKTKISQAKIKLAHDYMGARYEYIFYPESGYHYHLAVRLQSCIWISIMMRNS